jgi:hypothetical protein
VQEEKKVKAELVLALELGGRTPSSSQITAPPLRHGNFQHPFSSNSNGRSEQNIFAVHEQRPRQQQLFRYVVVTAAFRRPPLLRALPARRCRRLFAHRIDISATAHCVVIVALHVLTSLTDKPKDPSEPRDTKEGETHSYCRHRMCNLC